MGEPISPELVSVDPELAATARAALPEEPWRMFVPAAPRPVAEAPVVVARPLRRAAIALAFVAAAAAGIVAGSSGVFTRADDRPSFEPEPSRAAASAAATTGVTAPTTAAPPSATAALPRPSPTTTTRRPSRTTKSAAEGVFTPSRTFAWAPVAGADHYRVRFYRNARVALEGRAEQPRFVLPRRFEFQPGAYRWTVEPRRGEAYGPPVVDSRFEVAG